MALATPSVSEHQRIASAVESGKAFLRAKAEEFIHAAMGKPLLSSYSNDGTPVRCTKAVTCHQPFGQRVGKTGEETFE
eukprot:6376610-Lingulodinium_polyedra.AAC.1